MTDRFGVFFLKLINKYKQQKALHNMLRFSEVQDLIHMYNGIFNKLRFYYVVCPFIDMQTEF